MGSKSYSKGICWIDDCRIPFVDDGDKGSAKPQGKTLKHKGWDTDKWLQDTIEPHNQGRFPANILVSDDMFNDGIVRKGFNGGGGPTRFANATGGKKLDDYNYYGDKGSSSRYYDIDKWFDKILDV